MMRRLMSLPALALAAALALTGCTGTSPDAATPAGSSSSSTPAGFNDADVTFARSMIPHHEQAVVMAQLASTRAKSAEVKDLAGAIAAAQGPEIRTMSGWLTSWGQAQPSGDGTGDMPGMDHGAGGMPGMMSAAEMASLESARGVAFDRTFLTMMIAHHEGAIEMAKAEQADGESTDALALAKAIEAAQSAEVARMKALLDS